jgi:hypothetical protein
MKPISTMERSDPCMVGIYRHSRADDTPLWSGRAGRHVARTTPAFHQLAPNSSQFPIVHRPKVRHISFSSGRGKHSMTSTGAKVIAFELGLVIAILTWIAFDGLPGTKPQKPLVIPEVADLSVGMVSPALQTVQRQDDPVDYLADDPRDDQAETFDNADTATAYYQGAANGSYATGGYAMGGYSSDDYAQPNGYVQPDGIVFSPRDPADTIGIFPEPVLWNDYYSPYYGNGYGYGYGYGPTTQIVVINNTKSIHRGHAAQRGRNPHQMNGRPPQVRRTQQARLAPRMQASRYAMAPRMQNRYAMAPRIQGRYPMAQRGMSYGQMTMGRALIASRPYASAPQPSAPAQRSSAAQARRARPHR